MIQVRLALPRLKRITILTKIGDLIGPDHRLSTGAIAETVQNSYRNVSIITFDVRKVCARTVPMILRFEQQETRKHVYTYTVNITEHDVNLIYWKV